MHKNVSSKYNLSISSNSEIINLVPLGYVKKKKKLYYEITVCDTAISKVMIQNFEDFLIAKCDV